MHSTAPATHKAQDLAISARNAHFISSPLPSLLRPSKGGMHCTAPATQKAQDLSISPRNAQFVSKRQSVSESGPGERSESDKVIKQAHLVSEWAEKEAAGDLPPLLWFLEPAVESVTDFLSRTSLTSLTSLTDFPDGIDSFVLPQPPPGNSPDPSPK